MRYVASITLALLTIGSRPVVSAQDSTLSIAVIREVGMRGFATTKPRPSYPAEEDGRKAIGVVVVSVDVWAETGRLKEFQVLQSPSQFLAEAVESALRNWRFDLAWSKAAVVHSKLTFYFVNDETGPRVLAPDEF